MDGPPSMMTSMQILAGAHEWWKPTGFRRDLVKAGAADRSQMGKNATRESVAIATAKVPTNTVLPVPFLPSHRLA
jgi:hypothetical protein